MTVKNRKPNPKKFNQLFQQCYKAVNENLLPFFSTLQQIYLHFFDFDIVYTKRRSYELFTIHGYCKCRNVGNHS